MKKVFALILCLALTAAFVSGCGGSVKKDYQYQFSEPAKGDTIAVIHTSMGDITVRFFPDEAPKAVENFLTHAKEGYFDGQEWFRVMDFFIQSGDPTNTGDGGESIWGETFEDEIVDYLSPYYGALCMANYGAFTGTNSSQFFIITTENKDITQAQTANENENTPKDMKVDQAKLDNYQKVGGAIWLDAQVGALYESTLSGYTATAHTVFGQVIDGMDVAVAISQVQTYSKIQETDATIDDPKQTKVKENRPVEPVYILSIEVKEY